MDFKFSQIYGAVSKLREEVGGTAAESIKMEVTLTEGDPGSGDMLECLMLRCSRTVAASQYDSYKSPTTFNYTMEVFAESENRAPRLTVIQVRDLEKKEER